MTKLFNKLKTEYESSDHDLGTFVRSLKSVAYAVKKKHGYDIDWLCDAALYHLSAKTRTYIEDRRIGLFAALLVGYGSTFNQAMQALGEWLDISDTKIKNAYYAVCNEYDLPRNDGNLDNKAFIKKAEIMPYIMMIQNEKKFPDRYKKAYSAFLKAYQRAETVQVERIVDMMNKAGNHQICLNDIEERKEIIKEINQSYLL